MDQTTLTADRSHIRLDVARQAGLKTAVAVPVLRGEAVVAVIDVHSPDRVELTEQSLQTLTGLGYENGSFLALRLGQLGPSPLTPRQLDVLRLAADGLTTTEIAQRLSLQRSTVKTHFDHIYAKLGVSDRVAAVAYVLRRRLID